MIAGDDFADSHDTFPASRVHKKAAWGVKSAVARFSREVGSPFFLTFADRVHITTANNPMDNTEFENTTKGKPVDLPGTTSKDRTVRPNHFYSAWYMFK